MLSLGQTILLWREHREMTQAELSLRTGIPRPNLSRIERDRNEISLKTLRILAGALGVSAGFLVDGKIPQTMKLSTNRFSRKTMERIAWNASTGQKLPNPIEQAISEDLRTVVGPRLKALNPDFPLSAPIGTASNRAWLRLSALPKEERDSLIQRTLEHATNLKP